MRPIQRIAVVGLGAVFLAATALVFYLNAGRRVHILVDGQQLTLAANDGTVGAALSQAGIQLDTADRVTPPESAPINPAVPIVVLRAPWLSLSVDGQTTLIHAGTSGANALAASLGIGVAPDDEWLADGRLVTEALSSTSLPHSLVLQR